MARTVKRPPQGLKSQTQEQIKVIMAFIHVNMNFEKSHNSQLIPGSMFHTRNQKCHGKY